MKIATLQTTAVVENGFLRGVDPLPELDGKTVQIVVIHVSEDIAYDASDITEKEWHRGIASNPAFAFLADEAEDIYSWEDGTVLPPLRARIQSP